MTSKNEPLRSSPEERSKSQQIFDAIKGIIPGRDSISFTEISAAVSASVKIPKNGWMKVRGVMAYMVDKGMIVRSGDYLTDERYLTDVPKAKKTPAFFRNAEFAEKITWGHTGSEVFTGADKVGPIYSIRKAGKFLNMAGEFVAHESLNLVKTEAIV